MQSLLSKEDRQTLCDVGDCILICPREERTARELKVLSEQDRSKIWNDMTGRTDLLPPEDPQRVAQSFELLDKELVKIPNKQAFLQTQAMAPNYVNQRNFRLQFLRAEHFDPKLAAVRMVAHFEEKHKLFPPDQLGRPIRQEDLSSNDMETLYSGNLQILPGKDHANRKVLFFYKAFNYGYKERKNMLRTVWYLCQQMAIDAEAQRLGVVVMVYNLGGFPRSGMDYEKSHLTAKLLTGIPIRFNSFLVCFDDAAWAPIPEVFSHMLSPFLRTRLRSMSGSHQECLYKLIALGVPHFSLPVNGQSKLLVHTHQDLLSFTKLSKDKLVSTISTHTSTINGEGDDKDRKRERAGEDTAIGKFKTRQPE